jgi:hypothetical protein
MGRSSAESSPVSRSLVILVVTIVVVAAFYYGFSRFATPGAPGVPAGGGQHATPPPTPAPSDANAPPAGTFTIAISKAHPPAPSDVIRVKKDDPVTLTITTDRPGHLEVHGYRKEVEVEPGATATLSFAAVRTGRFPIDLHGSDGAHVEVTALEVLPR